MFRDLSIRSRLLLLVGVSTAAVIGLAAASVYSTQRQLAALESVYENQVQPATALSRIDAHLKDIRFRIAGVLLNQLPVAGSAQHLKEVRGAIAEQWSVFKKQTEGHHAGGKEDELIAKIDKSIAELPAFMDKVAAAYTKNDAKVLEALLEDDWPQVQTSLVKPMSQLLPMREQAVKATYEASVVDGTRLLELQAALALAGLVVIAALMYMTTRRINRGLAIVRSMLERVQRGELDEVHASGPRDEIGRIVELLRAAVARLREIVGQVTASAAELGDHSAQLLNGASVAAGRAAGQSDGIMHVSSNMDENAAAIAEVSHNTSAVAEAAVQAGAIAAQCKANMVKSLAAGVRIAGAVAQSSATIAKVSESVARVEQVTRMINEIAGQTNLLALNAAIEAARAGEHGRGFAVVSDEVRKLAERTASSTRDISNTVHAIREVVESAVASIGLISDEVDNGASLSRTTDQTLEQIVAAGEGLSKMAEQIAVSVKQQSVATEDVTRTMEKLSSLTEENASAIQQVDSTAKAVASTAERMKDFVGQFHLAA